MPDTNLKQLVKVAFASGTHDLNPQLVSRLADIYPELPLYVVSEFAPERGEWIPYHPYRSFQENMAACRAALQGKQVRLAAVLLVPRVPYRRMRVMALMLSVRGFLAYNENLDSFMFRPRNLPTIVRHLAWRSTNFFRWHTRAENPWRVNPTTHWAAVRAIWAGTIARAIRRSKAVIPQSASSLNSGISVVIPSRNGRELLEAMLPTLRAEKPDEIIVIDNGSDEDANFDGVTIERNVAPLSFARAVNRGIERASYSHVLLLNNDMLVRSGFLQELRRAFNEIPSLFCATAQIFFADGQRREETGKAMWKQNSSLDFPVRCEIPFAGEDLSYVLYGSGGCSLFDTGKLRALGGLNTDYDPAYVEDLDLGYRAWLNGWPSVFVAGAHVEHRHRATTSRYYTPAQLNAMVETNYLRFAASLASAELWASAVKRLESHGMSDVLSPAWKLPWTARLIGPEDLELFALGDVAVFPGYRVSHRAISGKPVVVVATAYLPFPLAHGGAVRIFHMVSQAASDFDQVMIAFCDELAAPPPELLALCVEIVMVKRKGTHYRRSSLRPDMVEELDAPAYHIALKQSVQKWRPALVQLEFTPMAQYARDCHPAKTILVEHDITFDLHQQLNKTNPGWEARQQLAKWKSFETAAWGTVDYVVAMSEKDCAVIGGSRARCLPNGVDLGRYQPSRDEPEPGRILFIGSFTHLPNLLALEFFLQEVWPLLQDLAPVLHVIAGARHEYYMEFYRKSVAGPGIELEGFVTDVRSAYTRASVVIAPLTASAGTNIKILEAMAMGKAIVSTPAGINGLDVSEGLLVESSAAGFAAAVRRCLLDNAERIRLGVAARHIAEREYSWNSIGANQRAMYQELIGNRAGVS